jgi:hypothetical protein
MYGYDAISRYGILSPSVPINKEDGNPLPLLKGRLTADGFPVRNHITQQTHIFPADCFAQFILVYCADFMEQGALTGAASDMDICIFQFNRYRFFNDVLRFVSPFLRKIPPVFEKYMWDRAFLEPKREEILLLKSIWPSLFPKDGAGPRYLPNASEKGFLLSLTQKYPYLVEPHIALASCLEVGEIFEVDISIMNIFTRTRFLNANNHYRITHERA